MKLAVAATETLEEAREFAESNGFHAVGFGARPLDNRYPGMAHFDRSIEWTADIPDIEFGLDTWKPDPAQEAVQDADAPAEEETAEAVHPPTEAPEPGDAAEPEDIPPESTAAPAQDAAPVQDAGPDPVQQAEPESPPQADAAEPGFAAAGSVRDARRLVR